MNPTTTTTHTPIDRRYEFVLLFDVTNGNPNGDPDGDNAPRTDPETGHGLVTDVCIKRKIRNHIALTHAGEPGMNIYIQHGAVLAAVKGAAYATLGLTPGEASEEGGDEGAAPTPSKKGKKKSGDVDRVRVAQRFMVDDYFDVRTFGAVMSSKTSDCGQVRGPVQLTIAESIDPVTPARLSITRCAVETQDESERMGGQNKTMGGKWIVPYGLYRAHGFVVPSIAKQSGFSTRDLDALWTAILGMFDTDRSASKGMMVTRKLVIFEHASALGNAPAHKLFELVEVTRNDASKPPRAFSDYTFKVKEIPEGVTCTVRE